MEVLPYGTVYSGLLINFVKVSRAQSGIFLLHAFRNSSDSTSFEILRTKEPTHAEAEYQVLVNENDDSPM